MYVAVGGFFVAPDGAVADDGDNVLFLWLADPLRRTPHRVADLESRKEQPWFKALPPEHREDMEWKD